MIDKELSKINWNKTSEEIRNLTRALNPIMGTYSIYNDKKIKFWEIENSNNTDIVNSIDFENKQPGTIIISNEKLGLYIKTGDGMVKILEIQAENSKKMDIYSFLRGNKIEVNYIFK